MSRVLVLQEDPDLGSLFRLVAESEGHQVTVVRTLDELALAQSLQLADLLLVELPWRDPEKRSLAAYRERIRDVAPNARAILCTSSPHVTRTSSVIAGFEGYVAMPFDVDDVVAEMRRCLAGAPFPPVRCRLA